MATMMRPLAIASVLIAGCTSASLGALDPTTETTATGAATSMAPVTSPATATATATATAAGASTANDSGCPASGCLAPCEDAQACAPGQTCVQGYCVVEVPDGPCTPYDLDDGCGPRAMCLPSGQDEGRCYAMPECAADGGCAPGALGAVCNEGYFPAKARICLLTLCADDGDCPVSLQDPGCLRRSIALGTCSAGEPGSPCFTDEHCTVGSCIDVFGVGVCSGS